MKFLDFVWYSFCGFLGASVASWFMGLDPFSQGEVMSNMFLGIIVAIVGTFVFKKK